VGDGIHCAALSPIKAGSHGTPLAGLFLSREAMRRTEIKEVLYG